MQLVSARPSTSSGEWHSPRWSDLVKLSNDQHLKRYPVASTDCRFCAPTPCHPSPQVSFPSSSDTASAPASSSFPLGDASKGGYREVITDSPPPNSIHRDDSPSQVPGGPQRLPALLSDPRGTLALLLIHGRMLLPWSSDIQADMDVLGARAISHFFTPYQFNITFPRF
jgi:hypothetical protein